MGGVIFGFASLLAMGNSLHEVEHGRNDKDRDERRSQHPADHGGA